MFNYLGGENVRFCLYVKEDIAKQVSQSIDLYFNRFLLRSGFPEKAIQLPVEGIFMPFPSNTIQYGLYSFNQIDAATSDSRDNYPYAQLYSFQNQLSDTIVEALGGDDEIDDETIISLSFYLYISWIKALKLLGLKNVNGELTKIYSEMPIDPNKVSISKSTVIQKYEENRETMNEIIKNIFDDSVNVEWVSRWITICKEEITKMIAYYNSPKESDIIFRRIPMLINFHLELSDNMKLILTYFLKNSKVKEYLYI